MSLKEFKEIANQEYKYGFKSDIKTELIEKGLNETVIREISKKNNEPDFILDFRLKAFKHWLKMEEHDWALVAYPKKTIKIFIITQHKRNKKLNSMDEVDPELNERLKTRYSFGEQKISECSC